MDRERDQGIVGRDDCKPVQWVVTVAVEAEGGIIGFETVVTTLSPVALIASLKHERNTDIALIGAWLMHDIE